MQVKNREIDSILGGGEEGGSTYRFTSAAADASGTLGDRNKVSIVGGAAGGWKGFMRVCGSLTLNPNPNPKP